MIDEPSQCDVEWCGSGAQQQCGQVMRYCIVVCSQETVQYFVWSCLLG